MWVKSPPDAEKAQWVEVAPPEILPHKVGESTILFLAAEEVAETLPERGARILAGRYGRRLSGLGVGGACGGFGFILLAGVVHDLPESDAIVFPIASVRMCGIRTRG